MQLFTGIIFLILCGFWAVSLTGKFMASSKRYDILNVLLIWIVIFFSLFFSLFFLLGYVDLFFGLHCIKNVNVLILASIFFAIYCLIPGVSRSSFILLKSNELLSWSKLWQSVQSLHYSTKFLLAAVLFIFFLASLMLIPGFPEGVESIAYHLPIAVHIFQCETLTIWDASPFHTSPANASLYFGFLLTSLSERIVSTAGIIFLIPVVIAIYKMGRSLGSDKSASLLASIGGLSIPIVAFCSFEAEADIGGLAFVGTAIYFTIKGQKDRKGYLLLSGLSIGLAFGFKSYHLVSFGFLLLANMVMSYLQPWQKSNENAWLETSRCTFLFLLGFLITGSFWLARNYFQLGNPIFPVSLPLLGDLFGWNEASGYDFLSRGTTQFEWIRHPLEWLIYPWVEWHYIGQNFKHSSGLGMFFAAMVPVACLASLIGMPKVPKYRRKKIALLLAGGTFVLLIWWILVDRQPRYAMGAIAYFLPLVAWTMSQARGRLRRGYEIIAITSICVMLFVILSKQVVNFGIRIVYGRELTRDVYYQYPNIIDELPEGSTIANVAPRTWNYALFGKRFQNRVVSNMECARLFLPNRGYREIKKDENIIVVLKKSILREKGITHIFSLGHLQYILEEGVSIQEIARFDKNPLNQVLLTKPLVLYRIKYEVEKRK